MSMKVGIGVENPRTACCGGCGHMLYRHEFTTKKNSDTINAKCKICDCNDDLEIE